MVVVSQAYKAAINADTRRAVARALIYFDGDNNPPTEFADDSLVRVELLEEARSESESPLGLVSSNELTIVLDNTNRQFTPTNVQSPYYGKLRPNLLVEAFIGLETVPDVYEYVPLGRFRTGDWSSPSTSVEATVVCYDRLYELMNGDTPLCSIMLDTTIGGMLNVLFEKVGLSPEEYTIDPMLMSQHVPMGWFPQGKLGETLQTLAVAGNCSITTDRYSRIVVRANARASDPIATFTDLDQIVDSENPQRCLSTYSQVKVNYGVPYIKDTETLLEVRSLEVPNGGLVLDSVPFSQSPVMTVDSVVLKGAQTSTIQQVQYGAWGITIAILNPGVPETVDVQVRGRAVELIQCSYVAVNSEAQQQYGTRELPISNPFIQSLSAAKEYAAVLLQLVADPTVEVAATVRGDPAIELGSTVRLQNPSDRMDLIDVVVTRSVLRYDGALEGTIEGRKRDALAVYDWVFTSPGLCAKVLRQTPKWETGEYVFVSPGMVVYTGR